VAVILIGTSWPGISVGPEDLGFDKVAHFTAYAVLSGLVLRGTRSPFAWGTFAAVVVAISLFGAADEWHQSFIPRRSMSFRDWIADTLGALAGALSVRSVPLLAPRRPRSAT
jgi:VanZ family protein